MLHEHRVEQGIQDAHISAVCFTTCIAFAVVLHRAIKQWSRPVQEQKGNQGRCPKWPGRKMHPWCGYQRVWSIFFCTITDLYELWPSPLLVFNTRHWTIRGEGALDYCFLQEYIVQCDCNQKVKLGRGPEWMVTWRNSLTTLKQNRKKSHCQLEYSNLPFLGARKFQREEKFPVPTFTVFFYCIFCFNFYFFCINLKERWRFHLCKIPEQMLPFPCCWLRNPDTRSRGGPWLRLPEPPNCEALTKIEPDHSLNCWVDGIRVAGYKLII